MSSRGWNYLLSRRLGTSVHTPEDIQQGNLGAHARKLQHRARAHAEQFPVTGPTVTACWASQGKVGPFRLIGAGEIRRELVRTNKPTWTAQLPDLVRFPLTGISNPDYWNKEEN